MEIDKKTNLYRVVDCQNNVYLFLSDSCVVIKNILMQVFKSYLQSIELLSIEEYVFDFINKKYEKQKCIAELFIYKIEYHDKNDNQFINKQTDDYKYFLFNNNLNDFDNFLCDFDLKYNITKIERINNIKSLNFY